MTGSFASLCIFTHHGHTYTFKDVNITCNNETFLIFAYTAMSDGEEKVATFQKSSICGWSVTLYNTKPELSRMRPA